MVCDVFKPEFSSLFTFQTKDEYNIVKIFGWTSINQRQKLIN